MDVTMLGGFRDELSKISGRQNVAQLLAQKATRVGLNPTKLPAITQVGNLAEAGNRSRAAEVAKNVSGFLKAQKVA
jgi:hypothetical protein